MESNENCLTCQGSGCTNSRNLVVCIDGTSNQFGIKNTNVVELYNQITKNGKQLTQYHSGLGAVAKVSRESQAHSPSDNIDMAIGRNLHKAILVSYLWLSDNYQAGDKIFLFGFSRGAYQVRALAGMIARIGLLHPGHREQIPLAFELYLKSCDYDSPLGIIGNAARHLARKETKDAELAGMFQETFCRSRVHIHFVGVWDTVSSVGFGRNEMLPYTNSCEHICYFRHALALDERRVKFLPEYVYGGRSSGSNDGRIKEVWFAGRHSDVGGGYKRHEKLRSGNVPLLWMRRQAIAAGLEMKPITVRWRIDDLNKGITTSIKSAWWLLEWLPFRHLIYNNSDRHTRRPHRGGPRMILPGQKVHVSVLFKDDYRPYAQFYNLKGWPGPMLWNDATRLELLQDLPDLWDNDIFDERSVRMLLDDLQHGHPTIEKLDHLMLMTNFDTCKRALNSYENATQILASFLKGGDVLMRLSAAVVYCEFGWDWPSEMADGEPNKQITDDISRLLQRDNRHYRACIYIPSLCKRAELKEKLISDRNLKMLIQLCDSTVVKHKESTSNIAFHGVRALAMLMKLDVEFTERVIHIGGVSDIADVLHSNCIPALISALSIVDGLAKSEKGRLDMKTGPIIATLLGLIGKFGDFVAPAVTRVLCSLLTDGELRETMLKFGVLSTLFGMLDRCSDEAKQVTCEALGKFASYENVRCRLSEEGYLQQLAESVESHVPSKRDNAIAALVVLGNTQASPDVKKAIEDANTIRVLVARLNRKSTALPAASVLGQLAQIDDVAVMVSDDKSGVCAGILNMLMRCWFDVLQGDSLQVLSKLLECEQLHTAVLKAGAIGMLRGMISSDNYRNTYVGLHYLRIVARLDEDGIEIATDEMLSVISDVVNVLHIPRQRAPRIALDILISLSKKEDLLAAIIGDLFKLLKDRHSSVLLATSTVLEKLATHQSVRDRAVNEEAFIDLRSEYHDVLMLEYDDEGRGPSWDEVYESVGRMISLMHAREMGAEVTVIEDRGMEE